MSFPILKTNQLEARFYELSKFLKAHQDLWRNRPFYKLPLSWEGDYPEISKWLRSFSEPEIERYAECLSEHPSLPQPFSDWLKEGERLSELGFFPCSELSLSSSWSKGIPGKKQKQIQAFCGVLDSLSSKNISQVVDWCSGKGHLGRTWSLLNKTSTVFVEKEGRLCQKRI